MDHRTYYVYEHWRGDRDECFYVGKGRGVRAHNMSRRNAHHKAIQSKLSRLGMAVEVRLVAFGLSQKEAFKVEMERIAFWRAMNIDLTNQSDGGDGNCGYRHTEEAKKKISVRNLSFGIKPPHGAGELNPFFGKNHSEETKQRLSSIATGRSLSVETRQKLSAAHRKRGTKPPSSLGRVWTEEQKRAQSERVRLAKMKKKELI